MENYFEAVRLVEAQDNSFGLRLVDCSSIAASMISTTSDPAIAESFAQLRASSGAEYEGTLPNNPIIISCTLSYTDWPYNPTENGPVFKAEPMEDKWDIYYYANLLYIVRSWNGLLALVAKLEFSTDSATDAATATLSEIVVDEQAVPFIAGSSTELDIAYIVRVVDFLIKSHIYNRIAVHPLPSEINPDNLQEIALFSFSQYGRRGLYASYEETLVS